MLSKVFQLCLLEVAHLDCDGDVKLILFILAPVKEGPEPNPRILQQG